MDPLDFIERTSNNLSIFQWIFLFGGIFFLGAMTAAIQRGINEQGWFGFEKLSRTRQTKEQIKLLENLASKAKDY
tara:strand:+ start:235 stop:459 length:225 start_codon:yes stop_codon:yes gene_type:complete